ncbi:MAG: TonB-dependent receptor [Opitutaceae bacterium]|nr:TonB-dependent receptor [Opitutaceae bacterium]
MYRFLLILSVLGTVVYGNISEENFEEMEDEETVVLPTYTVVGKRVAIEDSVPTFSMPVTALRFEPIVDLQTRNFGEAQGDVSIRGGIFEGTAFAVGGLTLYDPQTGHYAAEIPVAPGMLTGPAVLTGVDNAIKGVNAPVGTIAYQWKVIESGGKLSAGIGENHFNRQSLYIGQELGKTASGLTISADVDLSRSESDGAVENGDHLFERIAGRLQIKGDSSQTDLFAGYQSKFFGWPNLYTPFGVAETENLQTTLILLNHRRSFAENDFFEISTSYRRNKDDYEFDRFRPGIFNPFQHETKVYGAGFNGRETIGDIVWNYRAEVLSDEIESTALVFGDFNSRTYLKVSSLPEKTWEASGFREITVRAGIVYDDTNRDSSAVSPLVEIALRDQISGGINTRWYLQYSGASRVPGYTALNSNPNGGLFRGRSDLSREESKNIEAGTEWSGNGWSFQAAAFMRKDDPMVDWTYSSSATFARSANEVDIDVVGFETVFVKQWDQVDIILGYTWLDKDSDYGDASVDASFYALNYAKHRFTAAVIWRVGEDFEIRSDNELRFQEENSLRTAGGDEAFISTIGLYYSLPKWPEIEVGLLVDNLWDEDFQEIPAVPASGRQVSAHLSYRW